MNEPFYRDLSASDFDRLQRLLEITREVPPNEALIMAFVYFETLILEIHGLAVDKKKYKRDLRSALKRMRRTIEDWNEDL